MILRPDAVVASVTAVTPEFLRERGVRAVLVDLDDTLLAAGSEDLEPHFKGWLELLRRADVPVVILSNGSQRRVARWARELDVVGLPLMGKPLRHAFARGLLQLGTPARETAMVGDQLFTDVLGANLAGMVSILVAPLSPGKLLHTRALRRLERIVLKRLHPTRLHLTHTHLTHPHLVHPHSAHPHSTRKGELWLS